MVEDEALVGLTLSDDLEDLGCEVCGVAASAEAAVELAERHRPAVCMLDVNLRGVGDGITLAETMIERFGSTIIFLSGYCDAESRDRMRSVDPIALLSKPYATSDLAAALSKAFGER